MGSEVSFVGEQIDPVDHKLTNSEMKMWRRKYNSNFSSPSYHQKNTKLALSEMLMWKRKYLNSLRQIDYHKSRFKVLQSQNHVLRNKMLTN